MNEAHALAHEAKYGRKVWGVYPFLKGNIYRWKGEMLFDDPEDMTSAMPAYAKYNILALLSGTHASNGGGYKIPVAHYPFTEGKPIDGVIYHNPPDLVYDGKYVVGIRR